MKKATRATSMPIRNRPALTPSMTPNKGSVITQMEITNERRENLVVRNQSDSYES